MNHELCQLAEARSAAKAARLTAQTKIAADACPPLRLDFGTFAVESPPAVGSRVVAGGLAWLLCDLTPPRSLWYVRPLTPDDLTVEITPPLLMSFCGLLPGFAVASANGQRITNGRGTVPAGQPATLEFIDHADAMLEFVDVEALKAAPL
jgi:hypothetical protein